MRALNITVNLAGRASIMTKDGRFLVHDADWREADHDRDQGGRFSSGGGGGGAAAPASGGGGSSGGSESRPAGRHGSGPGPLGASVAPDPAQYGAAHRQRPRTDNIRAVRKLAEYTRYLDAIDNAKGARDPAAALARVSIRGRHTDVIAYRDALMRSYGATPPAAPPASAPEPAAPRVSEAEIRRATLARHAADIRPNPETHEPASSRPGMRSYLARMDEARQLPVDQRVRALSDIHVEAGWPRTQAYRDALIRAEGGTPPTSSMYSQPSYRSPARSAAPARRSSSNLGRSYSSAYQAPNPPTPPTPPDTPEAHQAKQEHAAMNVTARRYPADVKARLDAVPGSQQLADAFVAGFPATAQVSTSVSHSGGEQTISHTVPQWGSVTRNINWEERSVYHAYQALSDQAQGNGAGSRNLEASVLSYKQLGIKKVKVSAGLDVGGYAWAKFGFVPSSSGWRSLADGIKSRLAGMPNITHEQQVAQAQPRDKHIRGVTASQRAQLMGILNQPDPKALWDFSDNKAGKQFLLGNHWSGTLDLEDAASYDRCLAYARRGRST